MRLFKLKVQRNIHVQRDILAETSQLITEQISDDLQLRINRMKSLCFYEDINFTPHYYEVYYSKMDYADQSKSLTHFVTNRFHYLHQSKKDDIQYYATAHKASRHDPKFCVDRLGALHIFTDAPYTSVKLPHEWDCTTAVYQISNDQIYPIGFLVKGNFKPFLTDNDKSQASFGDVLTTQLGYTPGDKNFNKQLKMLDTNNVFRNVSFATHLDNILNSGSHPDITSLRRLQPRIEKFFAEQSRQVNKFIQENQTSYDNLYDRRELI